MTLAMRLTYTQSCLSRNVIMAGASSTNPVRDDERVNPAFDALEQSGMYLCMWLTHLERQPFANAAPMGNLSSHPP